MPTRGVEPPTVALRVRCSAIELRRLGGVSIAYHLSGMQHLMTLGVHVTFLHEEVARGQKKEVK